MQYKITTTPVATDDRRWQKATLIEIGEVNVRGRTPDAFVFVEDGDNAIMQLQIFNPYPEHHLRTEVRAWYGWIVVGFACRVELIAIETGVRRTIVLSGDTAPKYLEYYCGMELGDGHLLVCSAQRLVCIGRCGSILWKSPDLGIDGVVVHEVATGIIHGSGEWDPPGGWRPFAISLETGMPVSD